MSLFDNIRTTVTDLTKTTLLYTQYKRSGSNSRSFNEWLAMMQNSAYNNQPDFLDSNYPGYMGLPQSADKYVGVLDLRVSPKDLYEMHNRDTYVSGLFDSLMKILFKNDYYVDVVRDRNGKELGSKRKAHYYTDQLKRAKFEVLVEKQINAELADGGGNALLYTVQTDKGLEFRCDPFLYNGRPRVRVFGDLHSQTVWKYEILDEAMMVVHTLNPKDNYMLHTRYSQAGDFRFSTGPAKKAVYWYVLKKYLAGANLARFKNGLQDPVLSTPDYSALSAIMTAMGEGMGKVSNSSIPEFMRNPLMFLAKQGVLDDELLRTITGRPDKTNQYIRLNFPQKFERIGVNNRDMQVKELIALCDKQMGYAYRTSEGVINTVNSKFANAEVERDNWDDLVVDPVKRKIEKVGEEFYLPVIDPLFDTRYYRLRFGRDPDQEDLDIYNAKTERNTGIANLLVQLSGIPDMAKYNFETNEIEPVIKEEGNKQNDVEPNSVEDNDEVVEEAGLQRGNKAVSLSHRAIISPEGRSFNSLVKKSIAKQLKGYIDKTRSYSNPEVMLKNVSKDMPSISQSGLSVNTYKQQLVKVTRLGYEDFLKNKRSKRYGDQQDLAYPKDILDMLDSKAQFMVKGFSSLSEEQRKLVLQRYYLDPTRDRSISTYAGLDEETTSQINTIIQNKLSNSTSLNPATVDDIRSTILEQVDTLSESRANRIIDTEIAQSTQAVRYNLYLGDGWNTKAWLDSNDDRVRPAHRENAAQGYIGIDEAFSNGAQTPADEIDCRCDLVFGMKDNI